jgi:hypothetical protein
VVLFEEVLQEEHGIEVLAGRVLVAADQEHLLQAVVAQPVSELRAVGTVAHHTRRDVRHRLEPGRLELLGETLGLLEALHRRRGDGQRCASGQVLASVVQALHRNDFDGEVASQVLAVGPCLVGLDDLGHLVLLEQRHGGALFAAVVGVRTGN